MSGRNGQTASNASNGAAQAPHHDVLVGYLCQNTVTDSFHSSLFDLMGHDLTGPARLHKKVKARSGPLQLVDGRNNLAEQTIATGCDWLFMVDSDMGFEPDTLDRLLAVADPETRPVVGGLCFSMREYGGDGMGGMMTFSSPTILNWVIHEDGVGRFTGQDHYPVNTMIRVGATGAAMILIHRSVLEKVRDANLHGKWFDRVEVTAGELQGEDVSFCWRLRELGIPLWVHTGIRTTHMKTVWLDEGFFWKSRTAPPAIDAVDVIVPVLHRPQNVQTVMRSLRASTGLATAWFVCDPDDKEEQAAVLEEGGRVLLCAGTFAEKVNHAYRETSAPWLLLVGDDVFFRAGWLDQAMDVAMRWKGDVIATNDLLNPRVTRGEHATHPLVRRSYVDQVGASWDGPGVVCHEGYRHWYVDDEITWAAKLRGCFQAALASHVQHFHPMSGTVPMDDIYRQGAEHKEADGALFQRRLRAAMRTETVAPQVKVLAEIG